MTPEEIDILAKAVAERMERSRPHGAVPFEAHRDHHAYVQRQIEAQQARTELYRSLRRTVLGFVVIAAITALGTVVWNAIANAIKHGA